MHTPEKVHDMLDDGTEDELVAEVVHPLLQWHVDGVVPAHPQSIC
jgi:hypothetical protein